jgi:putative ABC transport system substrate-binding protein
MRRREFVRFAAGGAALVASPALAQEAGRVYRLGFVVQSQRPQYSALLDELRLRGFVEGVNLSVDPRGFGHVGTDLEAIAVEVAKAGPDAIYCGGDPAGRAGQRATATIPIVVIADDAVRAHLVTSLAHPGGNITGLSILATELDGKRLEILSEMLPGIQRMAALVDPRTTAPDQLQALIEAARVRGIVLSVHHAAAQQDIVPAIEGARAAGAQALNVLASPLSNANRALIIERAAAARLPAMHQWPEHAEDGALAGYGPRLASLFRQAAGMLVKVLTGVKPADIPVQQPTKIEFVINLKTAKALGLTVPQSVLARADEVIE